jgi:hypothetical protein
MYAMVAILSASASAAMTGSIAPGPSSRSFPIACWVLGAATSVADLRSMMKRSARMLVKKLMKRLIRGQRSGTAALIVRS